MSLVASRWAKVAWEASVRGFLLRPGVLPWRRREMYAIKEENFRSSESLSDSPPPGGVSRPILEESRCLQGLMSRGRGRERKTVRCGLATPANASSCCPPTSRREYHCAPPYSRDGHLHLSLRLYRLISLQESHCYLWLLISKATQLNSPT